MTPAEEMNRLRLRYSAQASALHARRLALLVTGRDDVGALHDAPALEVALRDAPVGAVVALGEPGTSDHGPEHVAHHARPRVWFVDGWGETCTADTLARLACEDTGLSVLEVLRWPL